MPHKKHPLTIAPQYLIDDLGKKTAVQLDIKTFENMLEMLEDAYFGAKAEQALQEDDEILDFHKTYKKILKK